MDMPVTIEDFREYLSQQVWGVSVGEVFDLPAGQPCPAGGLQTEIQLTIELRALLVVVSKLTEEYEMAMVEYEKLRPGDQKSRKFAALSFQGRRCELALETFKLGVRTSLPPEAAMFEVVGFNRDFFLWYGPPCHRDVRDLPRIPDLHAIQM